MSDQELIQHLKQDYQLNVDRIIPFKTVKKVIVGDRAFILKRVKNRRIIRNYNYLSAQKFANVILPLLTVNGSFVTRFKGERYYLIPFHANIDYPRDKRLIDYIDLLVKLHEKTKVVRPFNTEEFTRIFEKQQRDLTDRFHILDAFLAECETRPEKTIFMWYYLSQYPKIIGIKNLLSEIQKKIDEALPQIDQFAFSLIHNRPSLDHFIVTNEKNYLINFEHSVISLTIYDYIKLFIEYFEYPVDWLALIEREAMRPFEFYLFVFNVVYTIILNLNVTEMKHASDYIAINHFVYSYAVIEKLIHLYQNWMKAHASVTDQEVDEGD